MTTEALIEAMNAIHRAVTERPLQGKDKELFTNMKITNEMIGKELQSKRGIEVETGWIPIPWPGTDGKRNWEAMIRFLAPH